MCFEIWRLKLVQKPEQSLTPCFTLMLQLAT
jgi:hypothetical protein